MLVIEPLAHRGTLQGHLEPALALGLPSGALLLRGGIEQLPQLLRAVAVAQHQLVEAAHCLGGGESDLLEHGVSCTLELAVDPRVHLHARRARAGALRCGNGSGLNGCGIHVASSYSV